MQEKPRIGFRVIGTIKEIKGRCSAGHKVGDKFELSMHETSNLCGLFYHDIFPWILTLQLGGEIPWGEKDAIELECMDRINAVRIELRRIRG
ncbi:MAG: TIGR04076 family protein [Nitrososphaerota archaeon]